MSKHHERVDRIDVDVAIEALRNNYEPEQIDACEKVAKLLEFLRDHRPDLVQPTIR